MSSKLKDNFIIGYPIVLAFFHLVLTISVFFWPLPLSYRLGLFIFILYFVPPLISRFLLLFWQGDFKPRKYELETRNFKIWWTIFNMQNIFNRMPMWEEILRMIPGFYTIWLSLWGAKTGPLTEWAPKSTPIDRPFLKVGKEVIVGYGVEMVSHTIVKDKKGRPCAYLAHTKIGEGAVIGGMCLLGVGSEIAPHEVVRFTTQVPPLHIYKNGKVRRKKSSEV